MVMTRENRCFGKLICFIALYSRVHFLFVNFWFSCPRPGINSDNICCLCNGLRTELLRYNIAAALTNISDRKNLNSSTASKAGLEYDKRIILCQYWAEKLSSYLTFFLLIPTMTVSWLREASENRLSRKRRKFPEKNNYREKTHYPNSSFPTGWICIHITFSSYFPETTHFVL